MCLRITSLTLLCLTLAVIPASAQVQVLYSNGPINGTVDAWTINFGHAVSDSFKLSQNVDHYSFDLGVWEYPGDWVIAVDWSITSDEFGGITYSSGTANVTQTFISTNQYGYDIDQLTVSDLDFPLGAGTYWLNIQNATTAFGDPVFWDENSGPSMASESALGTIASEAFDITTCYERCGPPTPEPGSILLFGSGILGLAGVLRRRSSAGRHLD